MEKKNKARPINSMVRNNESQSRSQQNQNKNIKY